MPAPTPSEIRFSTHAAPRAHGDSAGAAPSCPLRADENPAAFVEIIGWSTRRRPLTVLRCEGSTASLRVLVVAGQRGTDAVARAAAARFLAQFDPVHHPDVDLAVLANANPDGAAAHAVRNAAGIDLERDHIHLRAAETRALHAFVRRWQPDVLVEIRTLASGITGAVGAPVMPGQRLWIDTPHHPALVGEFADFVAGELLRRTHRTNVLAVRRVIRRPPRRDELAGACTAVALRYGAASVALAVGGPSEDESTGNESVTAHVAVLDKTLQLIERRRSLLTGSRLRSIGEPGAPFPIGWNAAPRRLLKGKGGARKLAAAPLRAFNVALPVAYAVPLRHTEIIETLTRHGFYFRLPRDPLAIEAYLWGARVAASAAPRAERRELGDYALFPLDQPGGRSLAVYLEPFSQACLVPIERASLAAEEYPILRVTAA